MATKREAFEQLLRDNEMLVDGEVMTHGILIAAIENVDGSATQYCRLYPEEYQPPHITRGLLEIVVDLEADREL